MWMANGSICGVGVSWGVVGSSYVIVSAAKWIMTCEYENGPLYGTLFWYELVSGMVSMVMVDGSCLAVSRAQCMAWCAIASLCGCAYLIPFHLY